MSFAQDRHVHLLLRAAPEHGRHACRSPTTPRTRSRRSPRRATPETKKYLAEGEAAKKKLLAAKPKETKSSDGSTTYSVEMGASTAHTDVLAFAPTPRKVKSGDHVTFVNNSTAPHTASFGGTLVPVVPTAPTVVDPVPGPSPQTPRAGRVPQHRLAATEDEAGPSGRGAQLHLRRARARQVHVRVRAAPPERDGGGDRRVLRTDHRGHRRPIWGRLRTGTRRTGHGSPRTHRRAARQRPAVLGPVEEGAPADLPAGDLPRRAGRHRPHRGGQARARVHHRARRRDRGAPGRQGRGRAGRRGPTSGRSRCSTTGRARRPSWPRPRWRSRSSGSGSSPACSPRCPSSPSSCWPRWRAASPTSTRSSSTT